MDHQFLFNQDAGQYNLSAKQLCPYLNEKSFGGENIDRVSNNNMLNLIPDEEN